VAGEGLGQAGPDCISVMTAAGQVSLAAKFLPKDGTPRSRKARIRASRDRIVRKLRINLFHSNSGNWRNGERMKNLFVGNLPFSADENGIRNLFEQYGTVERVSVITDRDTGKSRGFGFVEMTDDEAAAQAIAGLNGKEFQGRALSVSEARPKGERGGGGGRERQGSGPSRGPRY